MWIMGKYEEYHIYTSQKYYSTTIELVIKTKNFIDRMKVWKQQSHYISIQDLSIHNNFNPAQLENRIITSYHVLACPHYIQLRMVY